MGNTSSTRFDDIPYLKRINDIFSTIVAVLLLLAVIIYAGERGYYAYHHLPARQSNFKVLKPVNFPAVTACPLEPYNVVPTDCIKETALSPYPTGFCLDYVYQRAHVFEGFNYTCHTFNDPNPSQGQPMQSNSIQDLLELRLFINASLIPAGEPQGLFVMLHPQGEDPQIELSTSFVAGLGDLTQVWIEKEQVTQINGTSFVMFQATAGNVPKQGSGFENNVLEILIAYTQQGYTQTNEFYAYSKDNWIGEVGGFAALMLFLHGTLVFLVMSIVGRIYKRAHGDTNPVPKARLHDEL